MDYKDIDDQRFGWRKEHYISNFLELAEITNNRSLVPLDSYRYLFTPHSGEYLDSLSYSILLLTYEATICFTYGIFQSCIITCGAVAERILRFEYIKVNEKLPDDSDWTLGRLIYKLDWSNTRITERILDSAKLIKKSRNDRIHANLEKEDPESAIHGGNRGITIIDQSKYLIEPYKADAKLSIESVFKILDILYTDAHSKA